MVKVAVVILNWNGREFLEKYLPSVTINSQKDVKIVVADNNSTDDSIPFLKEHYPSIEIVRNSENGGFAKGYNDALEHVEAKYYVLLNSDVEVSPNWIEPIIELMDNDDSIAACQPKIIAYHNKNLFEYAGASGGFIDRYGYPFCRGRIFNNIEEDKGQYDDIAEVFWASGACMFIRAELFHSAGGFDIDFFAHMEEIDLCWRLKKQAYKIMVNPKSVVYHLGGGTLNKTNPRKTFYNFRNSLYALIKNAPSNKLVLYLMARLILDFVAGLKFLFTEKITDVLAIINAHFHVYKNLNSLLRKRKHIKSTTKTHKLSAVYHKSIVFDHFINGTKRYNLIDKSKLS